MRLAIPKYEQLRGALGQRIRHIRCMLRSLGDGTAACESLVISFHTGVRQNLFEILRAKLCGEKIIREINEWPLSVIWGESRIKQWVEIHLLPKLFDGFICISDVLVDFCRTHGRMNVPIFKLPMTVDVKEIEKLKIAKLKGNDCQKIVVYAGSMTEAKDGVETLREAMNGVDAELLMVSGKTHDDAVSIMKGADCLVLARPDSLQARAGFPTKLGEYLATGVPVVVTRTGEIARYLEDHKNAYLVEPGDVVGIRNAIRFVLSHPDDAKIVGLAGSRTAQKCFDWRNHSEAFGKWLKQFI